MAASLGGMDFLAGLNRNRRLRLFLMATLKLIFGFASSGWWPLVGLKVIPPYFPNYELEDAIKTESVQATYSTRSEEDIRETIIKQARNYDIALTPKQVKVSRNGGLGTAVEHRSRTIVFRSNYRDTRLRLSSIPRQRTRACTKTVCSLFSF